MKLRSNGWQHEGKGSLIYFKRKYIKVCPIHPYSSLATAWQQKLSGDEVHGTDLASIDVSSIIYLQVMLAWQPLGDHLGSWFDMFQKPQSRTRLAFLALHFIVGTQEVSHDWDGLRVFHPGWGGGIFVVICTRVIAGFLSHQQLCPLGSQVLGISGEQADILDAGIVVLLHMCYP